MTDNEPLVELLFDRLAADVVLGAVGGDDLRAVLGRRPTRLDPVTDESSAQRAPVGLDSITVSEFRGVGLRRTLPVQPGPGLTRVWGVTAPAPARHLRHLE